MTLAELQAKRNELAANIRQMANKFNDAGQKWADGAEQANWDKLNADYDATMREMEAATSAARVNERLAEVDRAQASSTGATGGAGLPDARRRRRSAAAGELPAVTDETRAQAMAGWFRAQLGQPTTRSQRAAARATGINPFSRELVFGSASTERINALARAFRSQHPNRRDFTAFQNAAMTVGTGATGGYLRMPESMTNALEVNMLAYGGLRQVAELLVTQTGETFTWPTADDTSNTGEQIGENADVSNSGAGVAPSIGRVQWSAYKLSSKAVLVPYELLEDNVVNLPVVLGEMMGERIGRFSNTRYTTGTGSSQARGIVTAASLGVTAASATVIAPDEVYQLQHSVDPAYRAGAAFMAHDSVYLHLRLKKDSNGNYIWQSGFNTGVPDSLAGAPTYINQAMATIATTNKTLLYGQLSRYKIRRVNGIRVYRLEERYRDLDQDGFIMLVREDGNLLSAGTAPVKYLAQA